MKETEPTIIRLAREDMILGERLRDTGDRLFSLIARYGKQKRLGGKGSVVVESAQIFGDYEGTSFSVEVRKPYGSNDSAAVEFSSGRFVRSYVLGTSIHCRFDTNLDRDRSKGAWRTFPGASLDNTLTIVDVDHVNEALDLFVENFGKGVNHD